MPQNLGGRPAHTEFFVLTTAKQRAQDRLLALAACSGGVEGRNCPHRYILPHPKLFFLSDNFLPKIQNMGLKIVHFGGI